MTRGEWSDLFDELELDDAFCGGTCPFCQRSDCCQSCIHQQEQQGTQYTILSLLNEEERRHHERMRREKENLYRKIEEAEYQEKVARQNMVKPGYSVVRDATDGHLCRVRDEEMKNTATPMDTN